MIYTVTLNPALDYAVQLHELEPGAVNRADREALRCGGKGINISTVLHNLGVDNVALGFLAGFTGQVIRDWLGQLGVESDFCTLPAGMSRINVKMSWGGETELNGPGPDITPWALEELMRKLDALDPGDTLVLAGSVPPSLPDDIYERMLERLAAKKLRLALSVDDGLLPALIPYQPFLIKLSLDELARLSGRLAVTGDDSDALRACAQTLQARGARNILVSLEDGGALLLTEEGQLLRQEAAEGKLISSVGVGGSLIAGFLAGYQRTGLFREALRMGVAAGGATAFSSELATRTKVDRLLDAM